ncbi:hypothetical protein QYE76_051591 [Lolium multiflorum]|uniref:Uncharacterized protein n=1 Tax=Lolium multiflorum TaxID=4521 RepID=A0AAD8SS56_LOLMU|nr:hypothetical protein QYE76_051591 [Lolium multiflorum]
MADGLVLSGDGGRGLATKQCLACPPCGDEALGERGGPGVQRCGEATHARGARGSAHGDVAMPSLSCRTSWARACLVRVVVLSTNGGHRRAQGIKWVLGDKVARVGGVAGVFPGPSPQQSSAPRRHLRPPSSSQIERRRPFSFARSRAANPMAESSNANTTVSGLKGYDLSSLLTFDLEYNEPAASKASEESGPSATPGQLQHLKALISSSIETLVEDPEEVKSILEDIQPHLPMTLQVKLWPVVTVCLQVKGEIGSWENRLRHAQLSLKANIADKCQRLNEKKAALDAKTDSSVSTAELEILRKELEDLEERVRVTKQLIQDKEALVPTHEEARGLKAGRRLIAKFVPLNKRW